MLQVSSALKGYAIAAKDGAIGTISDFLFDQTTWTVRWMVVDTGTWLTGRMVLIHPSAADHVDHERRQIDVALTRKQVEDSPDIRHDRPVSQQMQSGLYGYYGWDPYWNNGISGAGSFGSGLYADELFGGGMGGIGGVTGQAVREPPSHPGLPGDDGGQTLDDGDPNLRSTNEITGYHAHASDGSIGHVEDVLLDDQNWAIRYLALNTSNWWVGQHVLISPHAITGIDWSDRSIELSVTRDRVKTSPSWDRTNNIDGTFGRRLHEHYDWPNYVF